jgi:hypothetical protein
MRTVWKAHEKRVNACVREYLALPEEVRKAVLKDAEATLRNALVFLEQSIDQVVEGKHDPKEEYFGIVQSFDPDGVLCSVSVGEAELELKFPKGAFLAHGLKVGDRFCWVPAQDAFENTSSNIYPIKE